MLVSHHNSVCARAQILYLCVVLGMMIAVLTESFANTNFVLSNLRRNKASLKEVEKKAHTLKGHLEKHRSERSVSARLRRLRPGRQKVMGISSTSACAA